MFIKFKWRNARNIFEGVVQYSVNLQPFTPVHDSWCLAEEDFAVSSTVYVQRKYWGIGSGKSCFFSLVAAFKISVIKKQAKKEIVFNKVPN